MSAKHRRNTMGVDLVGSQRLGNGTDGGEKVKNVSGVLIFAGC